MTTINTPIYGNDHAPVDYRRSLPLDAPRARYPGFHPSTTHLKKGSVRRKGARPLPCDIVFERDVQLTIRDGTTIYTDIFRPAGDGQYPAIVAWSPYGKEIGGQWLDDVRDRAGIPLDWVSEFQKFEGPDPAFWCNQGYVILNPDPRGVGKSEGNINYWGRQLAEDGYDFIEWAATQPWSNGKIGMAGNSWLAVSQWFIAAEQPPHLTAIAPWEGFVDHFRESGNRGGIPSPAFAEMIIHTFSGEHYVEDQPRMITQQTCINDYWNDKKAQLEKIHIPTYVVASYTNPAHTHGSFAGFREISSKEKWLRVNNTHEWLDFYTPQYTHELLTFFDYYLKGIHNDWQQTPPIRICLLDDGHKDQIDQIESSWPPVNTTHQPFFISQNQLSLTPIQDPSYLSYQVDKEGKIVLRHTFTRTTQVVGYMKLKLWVEAVGSDDMELSIGIEKQGRKGESYPRVQGEGYDAPATASGLLRVSHRALDNTKSTPSEPYLLHTHEQKLQPQEIVPVEIGIWPMAMIYHAGEQLVLTIAAHHPIPTALDLGFGLAPIELPKHGETFNPKECISTHTLGQTSTSQSVFQPLVDTPKSRNAGTHIIHFGGKYDSHLLIPLRY